MTTATTRTTGTTYAGIFTRRFGPPPSEDTTPTVLVHGLGLSGRYFEPLARRLAASGTTVLVPDLPGNARSRAAVRRTPRIHDLATTLARWQQHIHPGPAVWVGNSVGCQVIAALAAHHPHSVRRTVLVGPALDPRATAWRQCGGLIADAPREPLPLLALAVADYLLTGPVRCAMSFRHALRDAATSFEDHLTRTQAPTLVLRGAHDPVCTTSWTRRAARLLPDGHARDIPTAAHAAHYSAPDAVATLIRTFTPT